MTHPRTTRAAHGPAVRLAPLFVLGAAILWGTAGAAQELGAPTAPTTAIAALRSVLGGLLLFALALVPSGPRPLLAALRAAPGPLVGAGAAITLFQVTYFAGIRLNGVAIGTLLAIGSAPVWAGVLESLAGRPPGRRWLLATAVTVTGTALLVLPGGEITAVPVGVVASLGAGLAYASYTVASKRALERGVPTATVIAWTFVVSAALLAPALVAVDVGWAATTSGALTVVWLSLATIVVAYRLFAAGLRSIDAPTATTLTLAEPLTATVLAVVVLRERLGLVGSVGAALVVIGLGLAGRRGRTRGLESAPGRAEEHRW